jgi:hypothetical protein
MLFVGRAMLMTVMAMVIIGVMMMCVVGAMRVPSAWCGARVMRHQIE